MSDTATGSEYFQSEVAVPLILGASCFSILWGIINAIMVSLRDKHINCLTKLHLDQTHDMDNFKIVEQALVDAEVEVIDQELPADKNELDDDEEKVTHSPKLILHRIKWIGDQITRLQSAEGIGTKPQCRFRNSFT